MASGQLRQPSPRSVRDLSPALRLVFPLQQCPISATPTQPPASTTLHSPSELSRAALPQGSPPVLPVPTSLPLLPFPSGGRLHLLLLPFSLATQLTRGRLPIPGPQCPTASTVTFFPTTAAWVLFRNSSVRLTGSLTSPPSPGPIQGPLGFPLPSRLTPQDHALPHCLRPSFL